MSEKWVVTISSSGCAGVDFIASGSRTRLIALLTTTVAFSLPIPSLVAMVAMNTFLKVSMTSCDGIRAGLGAGEAV